ncbi:hypothetical protein VNI00_009092 [Paramarasmius palmivorus]|uniref:Uncharacterized protein n=1 Tax=Paramarasmius palmivorus TaxID=297713 RepID=A0AAW0CSG3_9AGAR
MTNFVYRMLVASLGLVVIMHAPSLTAGRRGGGYSGGSSHGGGGGDDDDSAGAIIGIVLGLLFGVFVLVSCCRRHKAGGTPSKRPVGTNPPAGGSSRTTALPAPAPIVNKQEASRMPTALPTTPPGVTRPGGLEPSELVFVTSPLAGSTDSTARVLLTSPAPTYNTQEARRVPTALPTGPPGRSGGSEPAQLIFVFTRMEDEPAPSYSARASDRV